MKLIYLYNFPYSLAGIYGFHGDVTDSTGIVRAWVAGRRDRLRKNVTPIITGKSNNNLALAA